MQAVGMRQSASTGQRRPDELAHELGVRLALGGLHDLADEEAGELVLAGPELLDLGRMLGQHRRHHGLELGRVGDLAEIVPGDYVICLLEPGSETELIHAFLPDESVAAVQAEGEIEFYGGE